MLNIASVLSISTMNTERAIFDQRTNYLYIDSVWLKNDLIMTSSNDTFHPFYISYLKKALVNKNRAKVIKFNQRINKKYAYRL